MKLWTDYPFSENDAAGKPAPLRKVSLVSYDGNKYVSVRYRGKEYSFKAGYLYNRPFRLSGNNLRRRLSSARLGVKAALRSVQVSGTDMALRRRRSEPQ